MSFPTLKPQPTRVLYVFSVILVAMFIMGFLVAVLYAVVVPLQAGIASSMSQYSAADSYESYELADTFMGNLWAFFLVVFVMGLLLWVYHYSQLARAGYV